jgi:hypothetical protein
MNRLNFKEGFRRFGVICGLLGFFYGVNLAFKDFSLFSQYKSEHARIQKIMALPASQQVVRTVNDDIAHGQLFGSYPVHSNGIEEVTVSDGRISSITLTTYETLHNFPLPSIWDYSLEIILAPALGFGAGFALGFLLPWGTISSVRWLLAGFRKQEHPFSQLNSASEDNI